jgi:hypothetical protein
MFELRDVSFFMMLCSLFANIILGGLITYSMWKSKGGEIEYKYQLKFGAFVYFLSLSLALLFVMINNTDPLNGSVGIKMITMSSNILVIILLYLLFFKTDTLKIVLDPFAVKSNKHIWLSIFVYILLCIIIVGSLIFLCNWSLFFLV